VKTFIFILILVIGFFFFLFSGKSQNKEGEENITSLEMLEKKATIETEHEVQKYTSLEKEAPKEIPQEQTFDTIKNIIKEARGDSYTPHITLNTRVSSLLYTANSKEQFKNSLASAFNLTYDQIDKLYKKNTLVWDWVNEFQD
jgi:hypothetical protein